MRQQSIYMVCEQLWNKIFLFLILSCTLVIGTGCKKADTRTEVLHENGNTIINKFDAKGKLRETKTYKDKDFANYALLKYDNIGVVYDSVTFLNNKMHGTRKSLTTDESITYTSYINGEESGSVRSYYSDMTREYTGQLRKKDHQNGEWHFYDRKGNIQSYDYYSGAGKLIYIRKYDSLGNTITHKGSGIIDMTFVPDTLSVNSRTVIDLRVANPPNCSIEVFYGLMNPKDSSIVKEKKAIIDKGEALVSFTFKTTGHYTLGFVWDLFDNRTGKKEHCQQICPVYVSSNSQYSKPKK